NTGHAISQISIGYTGEQWRNHHAAERRDGRGERLRARLRIDADGGRGSWTSPGTSAIISRVNYCAAASPDLMPANLLCCHSRRGQAPNTTTAHVVQNPPLVLCNGKVVT